MKLYLVVDEWQYDGGFTVYDVYSDPKKALQRQQEERRIFSQGYADYLKKYGTEFSVESYRIHRLEAVTIKEMELQE